MNLNNKAQDFLDLLERAKRGRLKIYLGFAAGVGKTVRMLKEAQALKQRGVDVVLAYIEPHGRAETADLIGGICDWDAVRAIADRHQLLLIHDSADTLGGTLRGRKTATRADISITSFSIFHIITALGNGGMVFFDDDQYLDRALALRAWGRSSEKYMFGTKIAESDGRFLETLDGLDYDSLFIFEDLAYGFIPNEAGAAFGIAQMNKIDTLWQLRNRNFQSYYTFFERHPEHAER